jgi:hypothetical protein
MKIEKTISISRFFFVYSYFVTTMASDTIAISTSTSVDINDAQAHLDRIVDACHRLKSLVNQAYMTEMSDADTDQVSIQ